MAAEQIESDRIAVELRGCYDGALFWYYPKDHKAEKRFEDEFYTRRNIDIKQEMEAWLKNPQVLAARQSWMGNKNLTNSK